MAAYRPVEAKDAFSYRCTACGEVRLGMVVKTTSFEKIIIDTTLMEKAVAYSTDTVNIERPLSQST